ncbi:MAG: tetratricopeptide repeat protein, partial [Bacteroidia bacterium]
QELDDKKGMANSYNNIGTIYKDLGDNNKALEIFSISLKLFEETKNKKGISAAYNNIGNTYFNQQNYSKALENFEAALKIKEKIGDKNGMAISYTNIGNTLLKQNNITEAKKMQLLALEFSSEIGAKNIMADAYFALAICDSLTGNFKSAYAYYKLFKQYNDSLFNEESSRKTAQLSAQYESEKKDAEIALLNKDKEKQAVITEAENKKQIIIIWSGISGLLLVIVFSVYILNRWKLTRQQKAIIETQKHIVEEKQKEILDSIRYAKRIQQSLLPSEKYITRNLKQHN